MCSKKCGLIVLFRTLLQQNTVRTCKHETIAHRMPPKPPKKGRGKQAPASPGQGAAGGLPQPGHASSGDGGPSLSPVGPSQASDSSVSPEKAGRRGQPSKRRVTDAGTEGSSWKGKSAVGALSFAQVSSGRGAPGKPAPGRTELDKRNLSLNSVPAAAALSALKVAAALNAASAPSPPGKKVAARETAAASLGHDQQTQDAAGQAAAPRMLFRVRTGTCHVDAVGVCLVHAASFVRIAIFVNLTGQVRHVCLLECAVSVVCHRRRTHAHRRRGRRHTAGNQHP